MNIITNEVKLHCRMSSPHMHMTFYRSPLVAHRDPINIWTSGVLLSVSHGVWCVWCACRIYDTPSTWYLKYDTEVLVPGNGELPVCHSIQVLLLRVWHESYRYVDLLVLRSQQHSSFRYIVLEYSTCTEFPGASAPGVKYLYKVLVLYLVAQVFVDSNSLVKCENHRCIDVTMMTMILFMEDSNKRKKIQHLPPFSKEPYVILGLPYVVPGS